MNLPKELEEKILARSTIGPGVRLPGQPQQPPEKCPRCHDKPRGVMATDGRGWVTCPECGGAALKRLTNPCGNPPPSVIPAAGEHEAGGGKEAPCGRRHVSLELPWPPTNNHYYTVARGRKVLSRSGKEYRQKACGRVASQATGLLTPLEGRLSVFVGAFPPDNRTRDLDNLLKAVFDVLKFSAVYYDDEQIDYLSVSRESVFPGGKLHVLVTARKESASG